MDAASSARIEELSRQIWTDIAALASMQEIVTVEEAKEARARAKFRERCQMQAEDHLPTIKRSWSARVLAAGPRPRDEGLQISDRHAHSCKKTKKSNE